MAKKYSEEWKQELYEEVTGLLIDVAVARQKEEVPGYTMQCEKQGCEYINSEGRQCTYWASVGRTRCRQHLNTLTWQR